MRASLLILLISILHCVLCVVPPGWVELQAKPSYAPQAQELTTTLTFYLRQQNLDELEAKFWEVSTPGSPSYGKYLGVEELAELVSPKPESIAAVNEWLKIAGASNIEFAKTRDALHFTLPASTVEKHFQVELKGFVHQKSGRALLRSSKKETLPESITEHVHLVSGISDFPALQRKKAPQVTVDAKAAPLTPGTPVYVEPRGNDGSITVTFQPVCTNGQFTQNADKPCSDFPPALYSVAIKAQAPISGNTYGMPKVAPQCQAQGSDVICSVTLNNLPNYDPVYATVAFTFENGASYSEVKTDYVLVPSPMVTPRTLAGLYGIPFGARVTNPNATQCVVEFEQQYYDSADLKLFFDAMGFKEELNVTVIGPNYPGNPGVEALLDIEYIMGVAPGAPTTFWSILANSTAEIDDILKWAVQMSSTENPPLVNSLSYGMTEGNVDTYLGQGYRARSDIEFKKLALRGVTIIIASGDTGAGDLGGPPMGAYSCADHLNADWPSQSPYVTAVGSTYISPLAEPICYYSKQIGGISCASQPLGEVGVSVDAGMRWTSGGGFSNFTARPWYQEEFVKQYIASAELPPASKFNINGRAYPDVVAVGHNLMVSASGKFSPVDGTSASAPIFAGVVTLLNDARLNAGKAPLGFLNPLLYRIAKEAPAAFNDVVVGRNACGAYGTQPVCCPYGYNAAPGFDAVSGLGSPNFPVLKEQVLRY